MSTSGIYFEWLSLKQNVSYENEIFDSLRFEMSFFSVWCRYDIFLPGISYKVAVTQYGHSKENTFFSPPCTRIELQKCMTPIFGLLTIVTKN